MLFTEKGYGVGSYSFLLLSGGIGSRSGLRYPKQFHLINGHPMLAYSMIAADKIATIKEVIINAPEGFHDETFKVARAYIHNKPFKIVDSGSTRQKSSCILVQAASQEHVILQEAARPSVSMDEIEAIINSEYANLSYCAPISYSMCEVDEKENRIIGLVDRAKTYNIQLPQKFETSKLLLAHEKAATCEKVYHEDAVMCIEQIGLVVHYMIGKASNIKITNYEDFMFAEHILKGLHYD